ncbi:MCE family protein [Mycolicibacterium sp. CH28]|uniref:MCE family protein n=1 Tax=Mycolicibacterium sp. CH28 TaxID=2512237 RepID=UPI0010816352|nr:MCE family protein [Mycolicibacterium sp. CH28]TGD89122.1 MCE family protein [Mycolicibacterium sp. CH28]
MRDNLAGSVWRLAVFLVVCALGIGVLLMVFAQLRFQPERIYRADFADVTGLEEGNFVRIAGVEVGKVKKISIESNDVVRVDFSVDDSVVLTEGTEAAIRWADMIGGRYLALEEGPGAVKALNEGQTIPVARTQPALDLDALIGGFRPLFAALEPDQVNALTSQLIAAFQGQGTTINSFLAQTAQVTHTLADRDALIGGVIGNFNVVIGSLASHSGQFAKALDSLTQLVNGLAARGSDIGNAVANTNAAAGTVADLLQQARPPLQKTVTQTDRAAAIVVADHDYFDDLLNTLPDAYQVLNRQGIYGDFFTFYLCDAVLKLNGKGGQPVYVKVAGQDTGRCTPK